MAELLKVYVCQGCGAMVYEGFQDKHKGNHKRSNGIAYQFEVHYMREEY